jgi:hypothetical protein
MTHIHENYSWEKSASALDEIIKKGDRASVKVRTANVIKTARLHDATTKARIKIPSGARNGVILKDGEDHRLVFDRPIFGSEFTGVRILIQVDKKIGPKTAQILKKNRIEEKEPKVPGMNWY